MNMPGFTAEASLFRASEHYHMPDNFEQAGGAVYPAQIPVPDGPILGPFPGPITPITILHRCHYFLVWSTFVALISNVFGSFVLSMSVFNSHL